MIKFISKLFKKEKEKEKQIKLIKCHFSYELSVVMQKASLSEDVRMQYIQREMGKDLMMALIHKNLLKINVVEKKDGAKLFQITVNVEDKSYTNNLQKTITPFLKGYYETN